MEKHDFTVFITGHTGIVYLIYPWGVWTDPSPDDELYTNISKIVEETWGIPCGQSSTALYAAHGTAEDYGYAMRYTPSWTFEVDSEQFVPVSGERISQRLQPIFECYMFLMMEAIEGKMEPRFNITDFDISDDDEDGFRASYTLNNSAYVSAVNGSAVLSVGNDYNVSHVIFTAGSLNETVITFDVDGDYTGKRNLQLELTYKKLRVDGAPDRTFTDERKVEIGEDGLFGDSKVVVPVTTGLILLGLIAAWMFVARSRKREEELYWSEVDGADESVWDAEDVE
jgi:hypothetical protein